jgi:hypothetical protein
MANYSQAVYNTFYYGQMLYVASFDEPIPSKVLRDFLYSYWSLVSRPNIIEANERPVDGHTGSMRYNLAWDNHIIVRLSQRGIEEKLVHTWNDRTYSTFVDIEIRTIESRDRLWEYEEEVRRICQQYHHRMADDFQLSKFTDFTELTMEHKNVFMGNATLQLDTVWKDNP